MDAELKVAIVHNFYQTAQPSGENSVVEDEVDLLRSRRVDVSTFFRHSDSLDQSLKSRVSSLGPIYSVSAQRDFDKFLKMESPDVIHVHNLNPLIGPAVLRLARKHAMPVVQTVHNYRLGCIAGTLNRDGAVCTECIDRESVLPGMLHRCYRGSIIGSTVMTAGSLLHGRALRDLDSYFSLSPFMRNHLVVQGVPTEKIQLRATWSPPLGDAGAYQAGDGDYLFVGRLDKGKGIVELLDVWGDVGARLSRRLIIAGSGPLDSEVRERAALIPNCEFVGRVDRYALAGHLRRSFAMVMPSFYFEGFPRVLTEAWSMGVPVIARDAGSLGSLVSDDVGWRFSSPRELASLFLRLDDQGSTKTSAALSKYKRECSPDAAYRQLVSTYEGLLSE